MATPTTNADGLPVGAPTVQQLDSLPSRLQVAQGIAAGTVNQATAAIQSALTTPDAVALQASDTIQTAIEDGMTAAAQVAQEAINTAMTAIENLLAPLLADIQANLPKARKRCATSTQTTTGVGPALPPPPSPPPLGCVQQLAAPGGTATDQLVCQSAGNVALPGEAAAQVAVRPLPLPPPPPAGMRVNAYSILYNCKTQQSAAVPNMTAAQAQQLPQEGWQSYDPQPFFYTANAFDAKSLLESLLPRFSELCLLALPTA